MKMTKGSFKDGEISGVSEAVRKLQKFPKEVIIEAFFSVGIFLRLDSIVSECKEIHRDMQFKMLLKRDEELDEQRLVLAKTQPKGSLSCMDEENEETRRRAGRHTKKDRQNLSQITSAKRPKRAVAG